MKLTDQEQVILKAIGNGVAEVSRVIRSVGYPKATVKKVLVRLNEKGIVALHKHDWPKSLAPAERKLMVKIGSNYYNAVSVMRRNPKQSKGKIAAKRAGRALKGFARGALQSGAEILGAGAMALNPSRRRKKNKTIIKAKRIDHLDVARVHNPRRRIKVRNKYIDLVIKGQAKKTPQGWKVGKKTFAQGRGTVNVSSGYYLDRHTGMVYAKRERNVAMGFYDASGFHPIRASSDYSEGQRPSRSKKAKAAKRKATATASHKRKISSRKATTRRLASRSIRKTTKTRRRKATTSRLAGRSLKKSSGLLKKGRKRNNPSAESIRKEFAGSINGERDLFFPQGTPAGKLAKLGKLVSITTEEGTIKPVSGSAWLCADTRGKLHIGSTSGAPLFDGPKRSFGHVTKLEYESTKPHLGYKGPIIWFHKAGEENGIRPTLHADGKGGIVFRGGDYRLTRRGIEN